MKYIKFVKIQQELIGNFIAQNAYRRENLKFSHLQFYLKLEKNELNPQQSVIIEKG